MVGTRALRQQPPAHRHMDAAPLRRTKRRPALPCWSRKMWASNLSALVAEATAGARTPRRPGKTGSSGSFSRPRLRPCASEAASVLDGCWVPV